MVILVQSAGVISGEGRPKWEAHTARWQEGRAEHQEGERMTGELPPAGKKTLTTALAKELSLDA